MTRTARKIDSQLSVPFTRRKSGAVEMYDFQLPAHLLLDLGVVFRLEDDSVRGVQRALRTKHARAMANAMIECVPFAENVVLNMTGECVDVDNDLVFDPRTTRLEIIDGQHRHEGLKILREEGREDILDRYTFSCSAVLEADDKTRRILFLAQTGRRPVSRDHMLAIQHTEQKFASDRDRVAYQLLVRLNEDEESPLKGQIVFVEGVDARGRSTLPEGKFRATALHTNLKPLVGDPARRSHVLRGKDIDERTEILLRLLRGAQSVFTRFLDPGHVLGQPLGISALFALLSTHGTFHSLLREYRPEDPYSEDNIVKVLTIVSGGRFQWRPRSDIKHRAHASPHALAERFNLFLENRVANQTVEE